MLNNLDIVNDDDLDNDDIIDQTDEKVKSQDDAKTSEGDDDEESELNLDDDAPEIQTAHDDFDWTRGKVSKTVYTQDETEKYLAQYEQTLGTVAEYEVIKAKVTTITANDVILDINYKSDGLLPRSDFRDLPELKAGDYVDVYVENKEDDRGQLILSRRKAKLIKAWETILDSYRNGTIIKGTIVSKTKGGLIADCNGLETFLPGSQIDVKPIIDYDAYVGKTMEFKVVKVNETIKNAVVSHKALIESDLAEQRETIIAGLEKGQVLEGTVKNITDFGAFMDLGGVDGLLYITDISWGRINHPNEILELNQKINVAVLDFDEDKKRISLGLKQLTPHPWEVFDAAIAEGSLVKGKIVNIEDYGAFLEIIPGVEGLIHVSEVTWSNQPVNAREFFKLGEEYESKVVTLDREDRKMSLSVKQMTPDPWNEVSAKYAINSRHSGEVKNLTPYGVFVELEEGIGGMIHISDLSWTKRYSHPSEFTKVGENIDTVVLELDSESRKLTLGHKQTEENPWDTFENVFPVGSYHEATIIKKDDRGAVVQLPYGLEAYAPGKHLRKDDGSNANLDETLTFKVIEFNREDKRIIVSHSRFVDDVKREADDTIKDEQKKEREDTRSKIKTTNAQVERATLGDLAGLQALKEQMEEAEEPKETATEAKAKADAAKAASDAKVKKTVAKTDEPAKEEKKSPAKKAPAKKAPAKKAAAKGDDLKKVEGIGPKIAELLNTDGIITFGDLADATIDRLQGILDAAGARYRIHDPGTWPQQSALARDDKWDELTTLQEELKGGKA